MTDSSRFEYLTNYFHDQLFADSCTISRTNFNFLLNSHNKYLKVKEENAKLKLQIKMLEMGERV